MAGTLNRDSVCINFPYCNNVEEKEEKHEEQQKEPQQEQQEEEAAESKEESLPPAAQSDQKPEVAAAKSRIDALKGMQTFHAYYMGAVFIGVALNRLSNRSLNKADSCNVTPEFGYVAIRDQMFSFIFFICSSGVASIVERFCNTHLQKDTNMETLEKFLRSPTLLFITLVSLLSSLVGGAFFIISMINTLEFKIGKLSCQSADIYVLVAVFCLFTSSVLLGNVYVVVHAFTYEEDYPLANFVNRKKKQD